ncbi:MAG: hypothetical protein RL291_1642, partial [Pseudomonadota bacterium]
RAPYDVIRVPLFAPTFSEGGKATGELRIAGLFTSSAYVEPPRQIPYLRDKVQRVIAESGHPQESHAAKALANVLDTFPRDELFQIDARELAQWAQAIVDLELRPRVRVFVRRDRLDRLASVLVYAPRDRYSSEVRQRIGDVLSKRLGGEIASFQPAFLEGGLVRIQFVLARNGTPPSDTQSLESEIADLFRTWEDRVASAQAGSIHPAVARLAPRMPQSYRGAVEPQRALVDMAAVDALKAEAPLKVDFYRPGNDPVSAGRRMCATVIRQGGPMPLSDRVPLLENLGFSVIEETTHIVPPSKGTSEPSVALHIMELETNEGPNADRAATDDRLEDTFVAVATGRAANDKFNRLVPAAGATWREVTILRAYAGYLRQLAVPFGISIIADALNHNAGIVRDLLELFHLRFNPEFEGLSDAGAAARKPKEALLLQRIETSLASVQSLDEDRILRLMLNLITATLRTNAFQHPPEGTDADTLAFKLDPRAIDAVPQPKPYREIWVSGPRVDGVHLRFGPVARGGLRWSDRPTDFRTEVLGLVKAQLVKNAVIVPTGAKGGFVPKLLPRNGPRDAIQAEGTAAYKVFIGALLDVTDNLVDGKIVPPKRVVRHDGDDPYLVVAADKGTATFSDTANDISKTRGHWLGDAFASGGSAGYDHKKMGITARGGWECVKRHFREMGTNIDTTSVSVIGIGDMSGDVFGNGMLLSRHLKLVAAFDHRDIFIDPKPDPAVSFAERARLFALPRSSWQDYDKTKISTGGGVFSRQAKSVALSPEVKAVLGIGADVTALAPFDLMRAILKAKADLLWFGGIGTYVRASTETDEQAGDRANDAIRVTGSELNVAVVGEGANLALTQRGRMEFALRGGRLNTDFIDNSAGVNSSDQEVNIKIALSGAIASGKLKEADRNALLATMTDEVAQACLANNHAQGLTLSLATASAAQDIGIYARLMEDLEARGLLDRRLEALPSRSEIAERMKAGRGLVRPELCPLLSFSKIALIQDLLASPLPERLPGLTRGYFPKTLQERFPEALASHRLAREIAATEAANTVINRLGPAGVRFIADATGRATHEVVGAALTAQHVTGIDTLWRQVDALDGKISNDAQFALYQRLAQNLMQQTSRFARLGVGLDGPETFDAGNRESIEKALRTLATVDASARDKLKAQGAPPEIAQGIASLGALDQLAPVVSSLRRRGAGKDAVAAAGAFKALATALPFADTAQRLSTVAASDYYDKLALATADAQINDGARVLAESALDAGALQPWLTARAPQLGKIAALMRTLADDPALTVSRSVVVAGQIAERMREAAVAGSR